MEKPTDVNTPVEEVITPLPAIPVVIEYGAIGLGGQMLPYHRRAVVGLGVAANGKTAVLRLNGRWQHEQQQKEGESFTQRRKGAKKIFP